MIVNYLLLTFYVLILIFSCSYSYAESNQQSLNFGIGYGKNIDGKYYDNTQSVNISYGYNDFFYKLGLKHYKKQSKDEYIADIGAFYRLYNDDKFNFMIGVGLEEINPAIEYQLGYAINNNIRVNLALNQILNDDEDVQNQREIVLGVTYKLPHFEQVSREDVSSSSNKTSRPLSNQTLRTPMAESTNPTSYLTNSPEDKNEEGPQEDSTLPDLPSPYVVEEGDWLMKVNRKYRFDLEEVIERNEIKDRDLIYPGMLLY